MGQNLVYNGDFHNGTTSWHNNSGDSRLSASNGVLTSNGGDLVQDTAYLIPVANGRTYRIEFDLIINTDDGSHPWYVALRTYDNNKQHINIANVNLRPNASSTQTTLAAALNNGDTTVSLTSATGWETSYAYQRVGICDKLAWGYNRATYSQSYASISGNIVTLKAAWAGGSFPTGTKVREVADGSTYYYPLILYRNKANFPLGAWQHYTVDFNGGDPMRYSCQYFVFGTLGYSHNYSLKNISIECISDYQAPSWEWTSNINADVKIPIHITKTGQTQTNMFNEIYPRARYIRDAINGSTANAYNHWCEFQVFNLVGENIALGKTLKRSDGGSDIVNSVATDGVIDSQYIGGPSIVTLDLGYVENLSKLKIWHYYPDGRTYYDNKTEISTDGINWITVYEGEKPETAAGNEIILTNQKVSMNFNGELKAANFIEY